MTGPGARRKDFRLTLAGFRDREANDIALMVRVVTDAQAPWIVVGTPPYDAVLLACGTRDGDAENVSVLRVANEVGATQPPENRRQLPLLLPRPIQVRTLRLALEAAIARLQARGLDPRDPG
jgi:hypothetical protein